MEYGLHVRRLSGRRTPWSTDSLVDGHCGRRTPWSTSSFFDVSLVDGLADWGIPACSTDSPDDGLAGRRCPWQTNSLFDGQTPWQTDSPVDGFPGRPTPWTTDSLVEDVAILFIPDNSWKKRDASKVQVIIMRSAELWIWSIINTTRRKFTVGVYLVGLMFCWFSQLLFFYCWIWCCTFCNLLPASWYAVVAVLCLRKKGSHRLRNISSLNELFIWSAFLYIV